MKLLPLLLASFLVAIPLQAKQIAGIEMPESVELDGMSLNLSGAGIRTKMFMDIYAGGLYLNSPGGSAADIVAADQNMAIRLHIVSGLVSSEAMEEATREGFQNATGGNTDPISDSVEKFIAVFKDPIVEGDVFEIFYKSGSGVLVYKNGKYRDTVAGGMPFKQAVFSIWLGDKPADKKLKKGMLKR
ncbi:MAG: chalcone isomerase family protein [Halioglobus sp.]